ncbi:hypothetical protein M5689_017105 [Euphorbia peplus]|nr:hypothetical protein M5689_017105 [Euphorbia peplus]
MSLKAIPSHQILSSPLLILLLLTIHIPQVHPFHAVKQEASLATPTLCFHRPCCHESPATALNDPKFTAQERIVPTGSNPLHN